jgi:hypothetical protein
MDFLFFFGVCTTFLLVLVMCLKVRSWESASRMINADWLEPADKFNLITRWGA